MRQCGFRPVRLAAKEILSAPDMPYPAIYGLATRDGTVSPAIVTDTALRQALLDYIEVSARAMRDIDARLSRDVGAGQPIIVWGTGELTAKLLADTALGAANIEAFVDSNPINQGGSAPRGAHPRARDVAIRRAADCRRVDPPPPFDRSGDPRAAACRNPIVALTADRRMKPHISVLTPCYNEAGNVDVLYERVRAVFDALRSTRTSTCSSTTRRPTTRSTILKAMAAARPERQGHRQHAELRARPLPVSRAAAVPRRRGHGMAADLQDPPELIPAVSREVARRLQGRARRQGGERGVRR